MREMTGGRERLPDDVIYKEVVVIGNGPSGISISHHLAGNWPSLRAPPATLQHPDAMLQARLQRLSKNRPLVLQPLEEVAEGLEGRSTNPLPLLMDNLMHPGADMGSNLPSMLEWNYYPERQIDHVVLGRGKPGGLWHSLDPGVVTLSPSKWMALPGLDEIPGTSPDSRAPVPSVASYYEKFVTQTGIQRFFRNNTIVTSVRPVRAVGRLDVSAATAVAWCVCGYDTGKKEPFRYVCSRVILATGASDRPNTLEGADKRPQGLPGAIRTPLKLKKAIDTLEKIKQDGGAAPLPVLVVGSGLSAADAILRLRSAGFHVLHAHRGASVALKSLPKELYPEYHQVYRMMNEGTSGNNDFYSSLPDHILLEIRKDGGIVQDGEDDDNIQNYLTPRNVKLLDTRNNQTVDLDVSLCAILIGSRPDLNFLADDFERNFVLWDVDNKTLRTDIPLANNGAVKKKNQEVKQQVVESEKGVATYDYRVQNNNNNTLSNGVQKREQSFEESLYNETTTNKSQVHPTEMCIKCSYRNLMRPKPQNADAKQCFLKMQWNNFKYIMGQGLQRTRQDEKSDGRELMNGAGVDNADGKYYTGKYLVNGGGMNGAIQGSGENVDNLNKLLVNGKVVDLNDLDQEVKGSGLGLGVRSDKPVDCRNNPIAIVRSSHAVLNAPKGLYALGPLTGDNFVRFIPGGALAIISDIWSEKKSEESMNECAM